MPLSDAPSEETAEDDTPVEQPEHEVMEAHFGYDADRLEFQNTNRYNSEDLCHY